jgi:hypothetical protein
MEATAGRGDAFRGHQPAGDPRPETGRAVGLPAQPTLSPSSTRPAVHAMISHAPKPPSVGAIASARSTYTDETTPRACPPRPASPAPGHMISPSTQATARRGGRTRTVNLRRQGSPTREFTLARRSRTCRMRRPFRRPAPRRITNRARQPSIRSRTPVCLPAPRATTRVRAQQASTLRPLCVPGLAIRPADLPR